MRRRSKALLDRAERVPGVAEQPVVFIHGCPDANRILGFNLNERQAMLGSGVLIEALPNEAIKAFHNRVCELARAEGPGMRVVSMSGSLPALAPAYPAAPQPTPTGTVH